VSVGAEPNLTYRSASPVPPVRSNARFDAPAGTVIVKFCWSFTVESLSVIATPF
jgi:hypothetical protein